MIVITTSGASMTVVNAEPINSGTVGLKVRFDFDESWDGLFKVASFSNSVDEKGYDQYLIGKKKCEIPAEVLAKPYKHLFIGLTGFDAEGNIIKPTIYLDYGEIRQGSVSGVNSDVEPTQDAITQIMGYANEADTAAQNAADYANRARLDAASAMLEANAARQLSDKAQRDAESARSDASTAVHNAWLAQQSAKSAEDNAAVALAVKAAYDAGELNGKDGKNGADGKDGIDGRDGAVGPMGPKPIKGIDYFTAEDKAEWQANLTADVNAAKAAITAQGAATLATIPAEYTTLDNKVKSLNDDIAIVMGKVHGFTAEDAELLKDILYMGEYSTVARALEAKDKVDTLIQHLKDVKVVAILAAYNGGTVDEGTPIVGMRGLLVTAVYSDDSRAVVETYTATPATAPAGENTITIEYRGHTAEVVITASAKTVTGITAEYNGGSVVEGTEAEELRNDITVTAMYSDGSQSVVNDWTITGTVVVGTNDFVIEYAGATAVITVTGIAKPRVDIKGEPVFDGYYINKNVASQYYQLATVNGRYNYIWHAEANKTYLYKWTYIYNNVNPAIASTTLSNVASNPEAGVWAGNTETDMKDATTARITTNGFILPVFVSDSGNVKEDSGGYSRTVRIQFAQDCWVSINTAVGNYALYIYEE